MVRNSNRTRAGLRIALAGALAMALGAGLPVQALAKEAAAAKYSEKFIPVFQAAQKAMAAAKARPEVVAGEAKIKAATTRDGQAAAVAELGALLKGEQEAIDKVVAAAQTPDDKYVGGQIYLQFGGIAADPSIQAKALVMMLDSGKTPAEDAGKFNFYAGSISYDNKDYAAAIRLLGAAIAAGYKQNQAELLLADSYFRTTKVADGAAVLIKALDEHVAAGAAAPDEWYRIGLNAVYRAKLAPQSLDIGSRFVAAYPKPEYWGAVISIVRDLGAFTPSDTLDLMRLMGRTHSYAEKQDYIEHVADVDPRKAPAEALAVIAEAAASGKVDASNSFLTEAKQIATNRIAADRASLPSLDRDARAPTASLVLTMAAADAFLTYADYGKAIDFYELALSKPGVDASRVNLRMGIAQIDSGDVAGSLASLAKVDGPRKPIAVLWTTYAKSKAAPAAAPAAAAAPAK
jgi:tetratricopeptide (TPR) repeat protein